MVYLLGEHTFCLPTFVLILLTAFRRYPEDVYDGLGTSHGNPWFLATATMAEYFYRVTLDYRSSGSLTVSSVSAPFFAYFAPDAQVKAGQTYSSSSKEFGQVVTSLEGWADAFIRRIKFHTPADGSLSEQYDRDSGMERGCVDLTWSYASLLRAGFARAALYGDSAYVSDIADL